MRLVWKCEYCSTFDTDKDKIEKHEKSCVFNPINRHCYSCDGLENEYGSDYCALKNKDFYDVFDRHKVCTLWYNSELRKKKLLKLKNVVTKNKNV